MTRLVLVLAAVLAATLSVSLAEAREAASKRPQVRIPAPRAGDFSTAFLRIKAKPRKGQAVPGDLRVKLTFASGVRLPASVAVVSGVRKTGKTTFLAVVFVVNKRTAEKRRCGRGHQGFAHPEGGLSRAARGKRKVSGFGWTDGPLGTARPEGR